MDAFAFLDASPLLDGYVITSLPDIVEVALTNRPAEYVAYLNRAVRETFGRLAPRGIAVYYQSDGKWDGEWVDKAHIIQGVVHALGGRLLWHKIALYRPLSHAVAGRGRPQYSHLLAFSREVRNDEPWLLASATPDVLLRGEMPWARAMGADACEAAVNLIRAAIAHEAGHPSAPLARVVDPFCGHGTALAVANECGIDAVGVDLSRKRCVAARTLTIVGAVHGASAGTTQTAAIRRRSDPRGVERLHRRRSAAGVPPSEPSGEFESCD
jgi:hypothetical protein